MYTVPLKTAKVGIREFRENLSSYLESKDPVTITRHGATIGIYVPTKPRPTQADLDALRVAGEKVDRMLEQAGLTEDDIMKDFERFRRADRAKKPLGRYGRS